MPRSNIGRFIHVHVLATRHNVKNLCIPAVLGYSGETDIFSSYLHVVHPSTFCADIEQFFILVLGGKRRGSGTEKKTNRVKPVSKLNMHPSLGPNFLFGL